MSFIYKFGSHNNCNSNSSSKATEQKTTTENLQVTASNTYVILEVSPGRAHDIDLVLNDRFLWFLVGVQRC